MLELARRVCAPLVRTRAPSDRHATSLSEQSERRLPIARRNCRLRGGTAECAEELGKLQLEARRLLSVSVPGVRLRRRQVLGPRRKRQRSTACSPASAACRRFGCGCRAGSCSCAQGGEGHRATARGRGQSGRGCQAGGQPHARAPSCTQWPSTQPLAR